ncbi:MAG: dTDP-epi-vancosaminyltransferase [Stenotrophomonas maltophilia]|uniref:dTDP-epi-vancosaminyltransferase n=1 Tax=Stenotrophomonas maltophilia TaxID=40324 RepID=A0A7V8JJX5_STEMA|nr:MAG: dTDP-epi-vancosaminyltransferase [Stenotrophomonas maltophilia]
MRLLALTYGTEGDTRPLVMLCHGLRQAGHEVMLLAEQGTLQTARDLGVPHAALEGDIHDDVVALVARGNHLAAASRGLARMARRHVPAWMAQADAAAAGCDAALTGGLAALVGLSVAERHGLPAVGTGMIPLTPTRAFASPFLPPVPLPGVLRRASYGLVNQAVWRTLRGPINAARRTGATAAPPAVDWPADAVRHLPAAAAAASGLAGRPCGVRAMADAGAAMVAAC